MNVARAGAVVERAGRGSRSVGIGLALVVVVLGSMLGASRGSAAAAETAPGGLAVTSVVQTADGFTLQVRNDGSQPCRAVDVSSGTISIPSLAVDGKDVAPALTIDNPEEPLSGVLLRHLHPLAPGATMDVRVPMYGTRDRRILSTVSLGHDGADPRRTWTVPTGQLQGLVLYGVPALANAPKDLCTSLSAPARFDFESAASAGGVLTGSGATSDTIIGRLGTGGLLALGILLVVVVLVVLLVVALGRRRRRQRRDARRLVAPMVLVLVACLAGLTAVKPTTAFADGDGGGGGGGGDAGTGASFDGSFGSGDQAAFNSCVKVFKANGDPSGIVSGLDFSKVTLYNPGSGGDNHEDNAFGLNLVFWNPSDHSGYANDPGVVRDDCSPLYHELFHALQAQQGTLVGTDCYVDGKDTGIPTKEVDATRAQNQLRSNLGLPVRTAYGAPLPPDAAECKPPPDDKNPNNGGNGNGSGNGSGSGGRGGKGSGGKGGNGSGAGSGSGGAGSGAGTGSGSGSGSGSANGGAADGERKAASNGDPHLVTFDGVRYDFQAVGEFVAARATDGSGFQIQVRQAALPDSRSVSVNTAIAFDVAGDHVVTELAGGQVGVRRGDDVSLLSDQPITLPKGGSVAPSTAGGGRGVDVIWPDGSDVVVTPAGRYGLVMLASLAQARDGKVEGLLGDADGSPGNDILTDGGRRLKPGPDASLPADEVHGAFADRWRVGKDSLLPYGPGQTTDTFTDRAFPDAPVPAPSDTDRAAAESVCRAAGVRAAADLAGCITDVLLTGEAGFGTSAAATTGFVGEPAAGSGGAGSSGSSEDPAPSTPTPVELRSTGTATLTTDQQLHLVGDVDAGHENDFTVTAQAGQIGFLKPADDCGSGTFRVDVAHDGGGFIAGGSGCAIVGRVVFPDAGAYQVRVSSDTKVHYSLLLTGVPADQVTALPLGQAVKGEITAQGAHAVYTTDAHARTALFYQAAASCSDPAAELRVSVVGADGTTFGEGDACSRVGRVDIPQDGPVKVVVGAGGNATGTGRYEFTVLAVPADQSFSLHRGDEVSRDRPGDGAGNIESPGRADRYVFTASAGDTIELVAGSDCRASKDLHVVVKGPNGSAVADDSVCDGTGPLRLPDAGDYVITVSGTDGAAATGTYSFTLR